MGLDIHIRTNNFEELNSDENYDDFYKYDLSRRFCNFMLRQNVVSHEPELEQIGRITGVDISPIYGMENYPDEEWIEDSLDIAESEEGRQAILKRAEEDKAKFDGNIDRVLMTLRALIDKLSTIDNLPSLLISDEFGDYFLDFNKDTGDGYIRNNFGQDLRNFKKTLEYAKSKGTTTVWFGYG